jgi:hypothetical protein
LPGPDYVPNNNFSQVLTGTQLTGTAKTHVQMKEPKGSGTPKFIPQNWNWNYSYTRFMYPEVLLFHLFQIKGRTSQHWSVSTRTLNVQWWKMAEPVLQCSVSKPVLSYCWTMMSVCTQFHVSSSSTKGPYLSIFDYWS